MNEVASDDETRSLAPLAALAHKPAIDSVAIVVAMVSFGAFFFLCLVRWWLPGGISELEERNLYVYGSALGPLFGIAAGYLVLRARRGPLRHSLIFPVALALSNTLFWVIALYPFRVRTLVTVNNPHLFTLTNRVLVGFIMTNAMVFIACWLARRVRLTAQQRQVVRRAADDAYALVPLAAAFATAAFSNYAVTRWSTLLVLGACGLPALAHPGFREAIGRNRSRIAFDMAAVVLIFTLAFDADYNYDAHHYAFYLGPAASLVGGGRPLVDINCQYGVGVVYVLAGAFRLGLAPGSYHGMSAIVSVFAIAQFLVLYVLLRLCLRSQWYALLGLFVILAERIFGVQNHVAYPSVGAMRFLWGYVFLLWVALRYRFPHRANIMRALEALTVGLSSIWSVETSMGTVGAFAAVLFYETAFANKPLSKKLWQAGAVAGSVLLAIGMAHGLLAAEIRHQTGQWPHWSHYLAYVSMYSKIGYLWALPILPWGPWAPIVLTYFGTLMALLVRRPFFGRREIRLEHVVVFGIAALGVIEFSYYIGRSHIGTLRIYLIPLFLAAYWLDRVARRSSYVPESFRKSFLFAAYASLGLLLLSIVQGFTQGFKSTALSRIANDRDIASPWQVTASSLSLARPSQTLFRDINWLVRKYEPNARKVALFMDQYQRPMALLKLKRAHIWPMSLPEQDALEPSAKERIQNFRHGLAPGSLIFVSEANLHALDQEILTKLKLEFSFSEVEVTESGLKVIRLEAAKR